MFPAFLPNSHFLMVVVTVQVTAVVLQLLSFSKVVVLGGCECTGDNCWVAASVIT